MRILTVLSILLVASGCGGAGQSAAPAAPTSPPAASSAPEPLPAPQPSAPATEEHAAPADANHTVANEATQSVFAVLKVKDPKAFVASLDSLKPELEKAAVVAYVVSRGQDQTDTVIAHLIGRSGEKLKAFVEAEKAKADGPFVKASELFVAKDDAYQVPSPWPEQETFSVFIRFKAKDYDAWRADFDRNGEIRAAAGVIGYGIHHSLSDDRVIVHYLTKSTDLLRQIAAMPEITKLMKERGMGSPKPFYAANIRAQKLPAK